MLFCSKVMYNDHKMSNLTHNFNSPSVVAAACIKFAFNGVTLKEVSITRQIKLEIVLT